VLIRIAGAVGWTLLINNIVVKKAVGLYESPTEPITGGAVVFLLGLGIASLLVADFLKTPLPDPFIPHRSFDLVGIGGALLFDYALVSPLTGLYSRPTEPWTMPAVAALLVFAGVLVGTGIMWKRLQ
jgi:hypothetical protein